MKKQKESKTESKPKTFNISSSENKKDLGLEIMDPEAKELFDEYAKENSWEEKKKNSNIKLDTSMKGSRKN